MFFCSEGRGIMVIAIGSTNEAKVLAVKEVLLDSLRFFHSKVICLTVPSAVSDPPISLQETIQGAKNRAKNVFAQCDCKYSFGIESGLMEATETFSGYLHVSICCIYDGTNYYTGLSTGLEVPPQILELVLSKKMNLGQACIHSGMSRNIGSTEGLIGILTKGKINRKEYSKQCVKAAILQLENGEWYPRTFSVDNNFSRIKAIIFDCDGTLVDSEEFHFLAWQVAFQKKNYQLDKEFYINNFSGLGDFEISKIAVCIVGVNGAEELVRNKNKFFDEYQAAGISPVAATVEFAKRLFDQKEKYGFKLGVASGARKKEILHNLKSLNIEQYFDVILSGRDDLSEYTDLEGTNKPKPYIYLKAAKMLGLKPEECVAIEDSRTGVCSAKEAGCFTIAVPNGYTEAHDLSHAHLKIKSFAALSVDDFLKMPLSSEFMQSVH